MMHFLCRILVIACFLLLGNRGSCTGIDPRMLSAKLEMTEASECVHKILQCTAVYKSVCTDSGYGELFESMRHLEMVCRLNSGFIRCVENAKTFCVKRNMEPVEILMIENRLWTRELCAEDSKRKIEYIKYAPCLNRELPATAGHCHLQFPVPSAQAGMRGLCRYLDGLVACKSEILKQKCGETAANLFRHIALLNGGREYLCRKHQETVVDPDSPLMIAAKMLNNFRNFMGDFSKIIRETMSPDVADDIFKGVDPRYLGLENPFDKQELIKMFEDLNSIIIDDTLNEDFGKPDIDELNGEREMEDFSSESVLKTRSQIDPIELIELKVEQDVKIPEDGLTEFRTNEDDPLSDDVVVDGSTEDALSCRHFVGLDVPTFQSNASFHLYLITNRGIKRHLGSGQTMVKWKTFLNAPLDDLFCSWIVTGSSNRLFRCAVELEELKSQQPEENSRTRSVVLSLYSSPDRVVYSGEILLTKMATICLEDYQPSTDTSMEEEDMAYPLKSTLKEFMHDQYAERSGELWNEVDSVKIIEDSISESKPGHIILEGSNSLHHIPKSYSEGLLELNYKVIQQDDSENEVLPPLDANVSYITLDENEEYQVDEENTSDSADLVLEGTNPLNHNLESYSLEQNAKGIPQEELIKEFAAPLDAHVSYISLDEDEGNQRNEDESSESERNNFLHHNPEQYSIEQISKETKHDESENEADDSLDENGSNISPDECKISEQRTILKELSTLSDVNSLYHPHTDDKHRSMYSEFKVPVEGSFEFGRNAPHNCKTESISDSQRECFQIKSNPSRLDSARCPDNPMTFGTNEMTGMYIDARHIETVDLFKRTIDRYNVKHSYYVDPSVNHILKGVPYIPSSETDDSIYYVTPSTKTLPVYSTQTVTAQIIEDEIENIYAEEESI